MHADREVRRPLYGDFDPPRSCGWSCISALKAKISSAVAGKHDVGFYGPAGIFIKVAHKGNLVVSAIPVCRLPQDKKKPLS
jgi:hypothetical protein